MNRQTHVQTYSINSNSEKSNENGNLDDVTGNPGVRGNSRAHSEWAVRLGLADKVPLNLTSKRQARA